MPIAFTPEYKLVRTWFPFCYAGVSWWDGEYDGSCCLREGHPENIHYDGSSWWNDDREPIELGDELERYIVSIYGAPGGLRV